MQGYLGRVTINGTQSQFSCKKSIPLNMWDVKGNRSKVRSLKSVIFITLTLFVVSCPLCSRCISKRFGGW